jgi:hypothetical protein
LSRAALDRALMGRLALQMFEAPGSGQAQRHSGASALILPAAPWEQVPHGGPEYLSPGPWMDRIGRRDLGNRNQRRPHTAARLLWKHADTAQSGSLGGRPSREHARGPVRLWSVEPGVTTDYRGSSQTLVQQFTSRLGSSADRRSVAYNDELDGLHGIRGRARWGSVGAATRRNLGGTATGRRRQRT